VKKIFLLVCFISFLIAGVKNVSVTPKIVDSGIKIIDIRTEPEWFQTGIIKGSIPITFFNERGGYDVEAFLNELNKHIKRGEEFALICRTGNRTTAVSDFLGRNGYNVINLKGGIVSLLRQGYKLEPYKK